MSATILKERVLAEIVNALNENGRQMMNLRYRPAQTGLSGETVAGVIPAVTADQLGIRAAELNAERQGIMAAVEIIEAQYKVLVAPEEQPGALVEGAAPNGHDKRHEAIY